MAPTAKLPPSSGVAYKQIVFSATGPSAGPHTLTLSGGGGRGNTINLDALDIAGTLTETSGKRHR